MFSYQGPPQILVLQSKREEGKKVQLDCIRAARNIADVVRTCLGPRSMLKMLLNPMGGIVLTNDGNAILREITVQHPAAKSMIEISRTQDEEVGDGTTSVIVLAGELLSASQEYLEQGLHPTLIISAYRRALEDMLTALKDKIATPVDVNDEQKLIQVVTSCIGTKFLGQYGSFACKLAIKAVKTVTVEENGRKDIDIKRFARIEKVPGGMIEDSEVLDGVMVNKDVVHPKMSRRIVNPRIILLDAGLEYKKGESQTDVELSKENDFSRMLEIEEEYIKSICDKLASFKPDLVMTEKGISDLAQHYLIKKNITCLRRLKKTDNVRIGKVSGATIVNRVEELREEDVGTSAGLFEVRKIGDEYFSYIVECKNPKACTVVLRGPSKDILNEVERNLQDAMCVCRNIMLEPLLVPGGGAVEMAIGKILSDKADSITDVTQGPYRSVARSLEVIPRTLIQNCGGDTVRQITALRAKHATPDADNKRWGIDGETGKIVTMDELNIWEPLTVKMQAYKTAIETAVLLLRIDGIVSGSKKKSDVDKQAKEFN
uniref:T-complex protein 1 subunit gamma n=1 Tax=Aceria tosichella TaxID=561515 RepID=A0A6G1SEB9_9ACAR